MNTEIIREDILNILKNRIKNECCSEYILGKTTCTSIEITYLFVIVNKKYNVSMDDLCNSLDDYLTIDKLVQLIIDKGELLNDKYCNH